MHWILLPIFAAFAATPNHSRHSVAALSVEGYEPLKEVRSFMDIGVDTRSEESGVQCELLKPITGTKAAKQTWAPMDFYTNVIDAQEQKVESDAGNLGEPDIFFIGDDHNRNNGKAAHDWTRLLTTNFRASLDFKEPHQGKDWFSFLVGFKRGKVEFRGLIRAVTWLSKDHCVAALFGCSKSFQDPSGSTLCEPDRWDRQILEVVAEADIAGAIKDGFFGVKDEREKNDVAAIYFVYQDWDKSGPSGKPYREKVASR